MSLSGVGAAQAAMLRILNQREQTQYGAGTFSDVLNQSLQTGTAQTDLYSSFTDVDMAPLLLVSLLGGGSSTMLLSLGSALAMHRKQQAMPAYDTSAKALTPVAASKAVTPAIYSFPYNRSASLYNRVIAQFSVETNPRYEVNKKGRGDTYCNIFVWDVTSAMGAEIPHYIDPKTGAPMKYPNVSGARELSANGTYNWLHQYGEKYGWYQVSAQEAQMLANTGRPVVASLKRSGMSGHIQIVCPSADGLYDPKRGVMIAQAGRRLTSYAPIKSIYKSDSLSKVVYFAHR
ncbi:MAG: hypothetical protein WDA65_04235 [Christensenellales bacterium]